MKYTHDPVYRANSSDVENFIKEIFGKTFDIVDDQCCGEHVLEIDVVDTGTSLEADRLAADWQNHSTYDPCGQYILDTILSQLSQMGLIPAGKWYIRIE